ncbi:phosphinothricin acetyltransferase [Planctomycetaceae bacterium]|nr:phosphinothricin acetyltransferase [Planctomycetaceae bacterium]
MGTVPAKSFVLKTGEIGTIRSAERKDAQAMIDHARANLREGHGNVTLPSEFKLTVADEIKWIKEHREKRDWLTIVAEVDGKLIGMLNFKAELRKRLAHRGMFGISIRKQWRGRGVGEAVLRALLDWATKNPRIEKVSLAVLADNANAIALYRKLGFIEEGRRVCEIKVAKGKYVDDLLMYRWVK